METKDAILDAATTLFATRGFHGASVREICAAADASINAISYHFGSKQDLYKEIIEGFGSAQLELAKRVLSQPPRSREEFFVRLELYFSQLLDAHLENRETIRILMREFEQLLPMSGEGVIGKLFETSRTISAFVRVGIERGFIAEDVDPDIVAGMLQDRVFNQARFTESHKRFFNVSTLDPTYRKEWIQSTLRIVLHGICGPASPPVEQP